MRTIRITTSERAAYGADRLRTASGREIQDGDTITPDDPIVLPAADGTGADAPISFGVIDLAEAERLATWDRVLP